MILRAATFQDIPFIKTELERFHKILPKPYSAKLPPEEYIVATLTEMIRNHVVIVATDDLGVTAGMIAGVVNNNMMNPGVTYLTELFWWVVPGFRKQGLGKMLLVAFMAAGRARKDVNYITLSLENNTPIEDNKVEAMGFVQVERTYLLEVKHDGSIQLPTITNRDGGIDGVAGEGASGSSSSSPEGTPVSSSSAE